MNNNHHISRDEIFPRVSEHTANEDHLKTCEQCNELVNILNHARKISKNLNPDNKWLHPSTLQLSETITQLYDDSISSQEAANFINHIESCSLCFNYIAMTVEEALTPVPENVLQEIKVYNDISLAEKVLNRESIFQKMFKKVKKSFRKIMDEIGAFIIPEPAPEPTFGLGTPQPQSGFSPAIKIAIPVSLVAVIAFVIFFPLATPEGPYDKETPFPYSRSGFRSTDSIIVDHYSNFHRGFSAAGIDYMNLDYDNYVDKLAALESIVSDLKTTALEKDQIDEIRDFYFYGGVSYFALSLSETRDLTDEKRIEHNRKAVQYLKEAQSISKANILRMTDRDIYFLGLSYGFGEKPDSAIIHFATIPDDSDFYEDAQKLREKWSEDALNK